MCSWFIIHCVTIYHHRRGCRHHYWYVCVHRAHIIMITYLLTYLCFANALLNMTTIKLLHTRICMHTHSFCLTSLSFYGPQQEDLGRFLDFIHHNAQASDLCHNTEDISLRQMQDTWKTSCQSESVQTSFCTSYNSSELIFSPPFWYMNSCKIHTLMTRRQ